MLKRLDARDAGFDVALGTSLAGRASANDTIAPIVREIIADVRLSGDAALFRLTERFDRLKLDTDTIRVSEAEIAAAEQACLPQVREALALAAKRIRLFHEKQMPRDLDYTDEAGVRLGMRWNAIDAVGIYVPGGLASYPSSVLMNGIPARVAGVGRLVMTVPCPDGALHPAVLVAAQLAGVNEIYRIGGAQAIAALAYGTESIRPVDKIAGPGNAYVAEAKRQVFGQVGIDMIAGPSEILVVADNQNDPAAIAADLLSQAEHGEDAQSILMTDDAGFADAVEAALLSHLATLPRCAIAEKSLAAHGLCVLLALLDDAPAIINRIAPEHLELAVENPEALMEKIRHAGAIFLGRHTPEAIGDYLAGPSHVLPTSQTARFSSGLSVYDFIKKTSIIGCSKEGFAALADATATLAESEGLGAHALSVTARQPCASSPRKQGEGI